MASFLEKMNMTIEEFTDLVNENSSFQGTCLGYAAEHHAKKVLQSNDLVESVYKVDDFDRSRRYDFAVMYRGQYFRVELKCISKGGVINTRFHDSRIIDTDNGPVSIRDKERGLFDILGVCMFNTEGGFSFKFVREIDIPGSSNKKIPEERRGDFLLGSIKQGTHLDLHECPFELMDSLIQQS